MPTRLSLFASVSFLSLLGASTFALAQTSASRPFDLSPTTAPVRYPETAQPRYPEAVITTYGPAEPAPSQFSRGAFELSIGGQGFIAHGTNGDDSIGFVTFDAGWYFLPTLSVDLEVGVSPGRYGHRHHHHDNEEDDGVRAVEEMALLRWHFLTLDRLSLFADGGVGGLHADPDFPNGGRRDNFLAAVGGGLSIELAHHWYGAIGARAAWLSGGDWDNDHHHRQWSDGVQYYGEFSFIFP